MGNLCSKKQSSALESRCDDDTGIKYAKASCDASTRPVAQQQQADSDFPELVAFRLDAAEVQLTHTISRSTSSTVWFGYYLGQPVAVKRMVRDSNDDMTLLSCAIATMARLVHPHIVRFIGCTWTNSKDISVVTEYMDGGDVLTLLKTSNDALSWRREKIAIAIDIAESLAYLHPRSPSVIHGDLKARNVLLTIYMVAKLTHNGLSRNVATNRETLAVDVDFLYCSTPEFLLGESYSEQVDVYAFGVVLSELDTCGAPFREMTSTCANDTQSSKATAIKPIKIWPRPSFTSDCPDAILKIARAYLQFDPVLRPSSKEVAKMLASARTELQAHVHAL